MSQETGGRAGREALEDNDVSDLCTKVAKRTLHDGQKDAPINVVDWIYARAVTAAVISSNDITIFQVDYMLFSIESIELIISSDTCKKNC